MKKMHVCNEKCLFEKRVNVQHTWMKRHACSHVAVSVLKLHKTQDSDPMSGANSMHEPIFVYTAKLSIKYNEMSSSWDCFICYGLPKVTTEVLNVFRWDGIPAALMLEDQRWGRRQQCFSTAVCCVLLWPPWCSEVTVTVVAMSNHVTTALFADVFVIIFCHLQPFSSKCCASH